MQETLNFSSYNFITTAFFSFVEKKYFNFFLSFARSQNTFLLLKFKDSNFDEIVNKIISSDINYISNTLSYNPFNLDKFEDLTFLNIPSFLTQKDDDEMAFLDVSRTLASYDKTFIGILPESFKPKFKFKDVQSRFDAAVSIDFEDDTTFDFKSIAVDFLFQNGIKIESEVLEFMIVSIERDITSFSIFIEELKKFVEVNKNKIKKSHFKHILKNYEKARG